MDLILGLLRPSSGSIEVDGGRLDESSLAAWRRTCGYVPQDVFLADDTIEANIAFGSLRAWRKDRLVTFCWTLVVDYSLSLGLMQVNSGIIARQRILMLPLLFLLLTANGANRRSTSRILTGLRVSEIIR